MSKWVNNDSTEPSIALVNIMFFDGSIVTSVPPCRYEWGKGAHVLIKQWQPAEHSQEFPDEERIDIIGSNGNDGEHYDNQVDIENNDIPNLMARPNPPSHKTEYYVDGTGEDWIDECARTMTPEEFRGAMKFVIGKYLRRIGKKDNVVQELIKVADYTNRWLHYEKTITKS